jgi:uncharacterized protein
MPLSRYLKIYPDQERPGSFLLYSTKKGSIVRLSAAMLAAAQNNTLTEQHRETLKRLEVVVDDLKAERAAMANLVDSTNAKSNRFSAIIVLTLDCNLACPYCYEEGFRGDFAMSLATAGLLVEHVKKQIELGREVQLRFYGGEPLMNIPLLRQIAEPIRAAADAKGSKFSFSLVSNGTLLTRQVVSSLLPLGLTSAQLTIDGPKEIHDSQRPFASGAGSFEVILDNIKEIHDLLTLKLGGNFTQENYREFPGMLDALLERGIDPALLDPIMFAPVLPKSGEALPKDLGGCCLSSEEPWLAEAICYLREETLKRGFAAVRPAMGVCMVELDNELVVNWDGSLYKCPSFMGWPELSVGTLESGIKDFSESHNLTLWHNDECLDCEYLPLCFGGCRLFPLLKNGVIDEVDCRRAFFDAALEGMILQDRRYGNR